MPSLTDLRIQGVAEPFWRGRVFDILDRLRFDDYKTQCRFSAYTNGTLLTHQTRTRLLASCPLATLHVSMDAATPETYRRIRRVNLFERVVANVRGMVSERSRMHQVVLANNINLLNVHEIEAMVDLAAYLGVDWVEFNPTHDGGSGRVDIADVCVSSDNWQLFAEAETRATQRAERCGVNAHFVRPLSGGFDDRRADGSLAAAQSCAG
jgi:MoaA/NifB/PqqE/SkfB family radical SAM enzyme